MVSLLFTLALRPLLLVTENVMLYSPGSSGLMPQASSTGTNRCPLLEACHLQKQCKGACDKFCRAAD